MVQGPLSSELLGQLITPFLPIAHFPPPISLYFRSPQRNLVLRNCRQSSNTWYPLIFSSETRATATASGTRWSTKWFWDSSHFPRSACCTSESQTITLQPRKTFHPRLSRITLSTRREGWIMGIWTFQRQRERFGSSRCLPLLACLHDFPLPQSRCLSLPLPLPLPLPPLNPLSLRPSLLNLLACTSHACIPSFATF